MSIMSYSGGTVFAMTGHECVCIGTDLRMGEQTNMIATNVEKIYKISNKIYLGLCGFNSDAHTIYNKMTISKNLYELRENRAIKPSTIHTMLGNLLYSRRFGPYYSDPIVAGMDPETNQPFIGGFDVIGAPSTPQDYVAAGCAAEYCVLAGEGFWRKGMNPDELFEATAQSLLCGLERDAASGYGAIIYTITKDKVNIKSIKTRMD